MSYWIAKIVYNLTLLPWRIVLKTFLHHRTIFKDIKVKQLKGPFIIAANHTLSIDAFIISTIFPLFSSAFPIRFAVYHTFFRYFQTALIVRIYGSFSVRRKVGIQKVLAPAVRFLQKGQVIGIFPEGRRRHLGRPRKGRRGAAYLSIATKSPILPCRIEGALGLTFKKFILRQGHVTVYIGVPFYLPKRLNDPDNIEHLNEATEIIMEKIAKLHR